MTSTPQTTQPAASAHPLGSLRPFGWMLLGGFIALGAAAMLGNSGVQVPEAAPVIVTADANAYLIANDNRVFFLRGNSAVEVVGLPNNWR